MKKRSALKDHLKESRLYLNRAIIALIFISVLFVLLTSRLVFLQIIQHDLYQTLSLNNQVRMIPITPNRGLIFDRDGVLLAENIPAFSLEITPERTPDIEVTLQEIQMIMPLTENELYHFRKQLKYKKKNESIPIRLKLTEVEVAKLSVEKHRLPGVEIVAQLIRHYPLGEATAHALGYVGPISQKDQEEIDAANYRGTHYMGKIGLEKFYESILHGKTGYQHVETDAKGRTIRVLNRIAPEPGANLHLSLDSKLQQAAFNALEGLKGAIIAIDPQNGGILALISKPSFNPNLFAQGIDAITYRNLQNDPEKPLFNRAIRGQYPPGSTVKPLVALKALETGITNTHFKIFDPGWYQLNGVGRLYRDWIFHSKRHGHGSVDLDKAIAQSCDTYFFTISHKLGVDHLHDVFTQFGLGKKTNLDTTSELSGLAPSPAWKRKVYNEPWYPGDTLNIGIGQGTLLATPLQVAYFTALIANQGQSFQPRFLSHIDYQNQNSPQPEDPILPPPITLKNKEHWKIVINAMKNVVHLPGSTAYRISHGLTYQMAGKTGTAQVFNLKQNEKYEANKIKAHLRDHSWFIAFAPVENPKIAIAVLVENKTTKTGADVARVVLDHFFHLKPSEEELKSSQNIIHNLDEDESEVGGAEDSE